MPTTTNGRRLAILASTLVLLLIVCGTLFLMPLKSARADDGGYPYASYNGPGSDAKSSYWTDPNPGTHNGQPGSPYGYYYRNCTDFVAWKMAQASANNFSIPSNLGHAASWGTTESSITNKIPATGAVAWWGATNSNQWGHVAWVSAVNTDSKGHVSVNLEEYNWPITVNGIASFDGAYHTRTVAANVPTGYIHFHDIGSNPVFSNTVLAVKKVTQSDGTNEVFWAKATNVFESWWRGSSGITTSSLVYITQGDIVAIDAQLMPDNKHLLYTATAHNVWETWWYPGQGSHSAAILQNVGNVRSIQKTIGPDGVTNQLYVMTDSGVSEYWWNSTSNGVQGGSLYRLANPVAMKKALEPDGTQMLLVADQNYAYMVRWGSNLSGIQVSQVINVSGITSLDFSEDVGGKHRLYIGTNNGSIWEASWYTGGSIGYWYMTGGPPVVALQKWESDSTQVLYEATAGGVFEYYWLSSSNASLKGDTIVGGLSNVHAFVRSTDPGGVQSVYTATGTNVLEAWWIPGGNGVHTGKIE